MKPLFSQSGLRQRRYWVDVLYRIADPVFTALAGNRLKASMPIETLKGQVRKRRQASYLEAFGRSLAGVAPWLAVSGLKGRERKLQQTMLRQILTSLDHATDPNAPDHMSFHHPGQALVDAAFLAQGLLRAGEAVWSALDDRVQKNILRSLRSTRSITPMFSNWLFFPAMIEAFFCQVGEEWDATRVDYAIRQHLQWYVGDGAYSDGPFFHWDYYNSFVIQPMLLDVIRTVSTPSSRWKTFEAPLFARARRYAAVQERMIAPDGSYPVLGRSICYRFGAFQSLSQMALLRNLPENLPPAQVRCALTGVIERVIEAPNTFDERGWLRIGLCGHQPSLGEGYISTGSLYLCLCGLLALGLPPDDEFWSAPSEPWTAMQAWTGLDATRDGALNDVPDRGLMVGI